MEEHIAQEPTNCKAQKDFQRPCSSSVLHAGSRLDGDDEQGQDAAQPHDHRADGRQQPGVVLHLGQELRHFQKEPPVHSVLGRRIGPVPDAGRVRLHQVHDGAHDALQQQIVSDRETPNTHTRTRSHHMERADGAPVSESCRGTAKG